MMTTKKTQKGFALLIAILTASIVLAIGISILNIALKGFLLSTTVRESQTAFYAADAGIECARYFDFSENGGHRFERGSPSGPMRCMGGNVFQVNDDTNTVHTAIGNNNFGATEGFQIEWGDPEICARVYVTKYRNDSGTVSMPDGKGGTETCAQGFTCTIVQSYGYNRACTDIEDDPRTVERGIRSRY